MKTTLRGSVLVLIGAFCFSTSGTLQAIAPSGATPYTIACSRMLIGAIVLFLWCRLKRIRFSKIGWPIRPLIYVVSTLFLFQIVFFSSVIYVGVAVGTVVSIGSTPILAGAINWIARGERPTRYWYPATVLSIVGLILVNDVGESSFPFWSLIGPVTAGLCYAVEINYIEFLTRNHPPEEAMTVVMLIVGLLLLPIAFFHPVAWIFTPQGGTVVFGLGFVTAALAFSLLAAGLRETSATIGSTLALGEPLGAALLGIFFLNEPCTVSSICGICLIFLSLLFLIFSEARLK